MIKKGIILAGGKGTRLHPATIPMSKQLLTVYDKPLIYYPLSTLMLAGIKDILIITTPEDQSNFEKLLGDGSQFGIKFSYEQQDKPKGLADAFIIGEKFIDKKPCCLILGDNIFYGTDLPKILRETAKKEHGATVFGYKVPDPQRYGVVEFDKNNQVLSIEEKPSKPKSNYAVVGLYFYDNQVTEIAKGLKPSPPPRNEIEITDLNLEYLLKGQLDVKRLGRGVAWFDTGTPNSLNDAANYIRIIQAIQGFKIGCPEEVAYIMGFITKEKLEQLASNYNGSDYGKYLFECLRQD